MRRHRWLGLFGAGVVVLLAGGAVAVRVATDSAGDEIKAAVEEFFDARRDGDCDRLQAVVSEASQSEDVTLGRLGFLELCPEVVDDYQPDWDEVRVLSHDGDSATVQIRLRLEDDADGDLAERRRSEGLVVDEPGVVDSGKSAYEDGRLVREDRHWKVEMDGGAFGLGPSVRDTVLDFLEAYRDGNCEEVAELVSYQGLSTDGAPDRAEFMTDCATVAGARGELLADSILTDDEDDAEELLTVLPKVDMPSRDTAMWTTEQQGKSFAQPLRPGDEPFELVVEDLRWKLAGLDGISAFARGAEYVRLFEQLPDQVLGLGALDVTTRSPNEFTDVPPNVTSPEAGLEAAFGAEGGLQVELSLYQLPDVPAAVGFAQHLADRDMQLATRHHGLPPAVPDPAIPGVSAVVSRCDTRVWQQACTHGDEAAAVSAQDRYVVHVLVQEPPLRDFTRGEYPTADVVLDHAIEALTTQLESLP